MIKLFNEMCCQDILYSDNNRKDINILFIQDNLYEKMLEIIYTVLLLSASRVISAGV